jgi:predicted transglutaminase-like cysteine proteinase
MTVTVKAGEVVFPAWMLLFTLHSAGAESIRQKFDDIAVVAQQETGLDQIREINFSINTLLNTTHFFSESPETDHWRSVDTILDSKYRDDCKDFVVLKEELLRRVGIKSERILVLIRSSTRYSNELHVVLVIHYGEREIVLDNLRNVLVTLEDLKDVYEVYDGAP